MASARPSGSPDRSIAERVRAYIDERPVVREALSMGLVNLSELTRRIVEETDVDKKHAVLAACRRHRESLGEPGLGDALREQLSACRLQIRTQVDVVTLERSGDGLPPRGALEATEADEAPFHVLNSPATTTLIGDRRRLDRVLRHVEENAIVDVERGLVAVRVDAPPSVRRTPGVLAFLSSSIAQRGVSFVEIVSTYEEMVFVLDREDLTPAIEVLDRLVGDPAPSE